MKLIYLFYLWGTVLALDGVVTFTALKLGFFEANPFVAPFIQAFGPVGILFHHLLAFVLLTPVLRMKRAYIFFAGTSLAFVMAIVNNLVLMNFLNFWIPIWIAIILFFILCWWLPRRFAEDDKKRL